jgi:hypothetical protein
MPPVLRHRRVGGFTRLAAEAPAEVVCGDKDAKRRMVESNLRLVIAVGREHRSSAAVDGYVTLEKPPPDAQHVVVSALCADFAPLAARAAERGERGPGARAAT